MKDTRATDYFTKLCETTNYGGTIACCELAMAYNFANMPTGWFARIENDSVFITCPKCKGSNN